MKIWLTAFALAAVALVLAGVEAPAQEDTHFLEHKEFSPRQRPGVNFPHALHFGILECTDCHHVYENGQNVWDPSSETSCAACHTVAGDGKTLPLMQAFHRQCIGCHETTLKKDAKTGPLMCGECHVRNKAGG